MPKTGRVSAAEDFRFRFVKPRYSEPLQLTEGSSGEPGEISARATSMEKAQFDGSRSARAVEDCSRIGSSHEEWPRLGGNVVAVVDVLTAAFDAEGRC